jgi:hypothetical protein
MGGVDSFLNESMALPQTFEVPPKRREHMKVSLGLGDKPRMERACLLHMSMRLLMEVDRTASVGHIC